MTIPSIRRLDPQDWKINGDSLVAWINDLEFFDIRPDFYSLPSGQVQEGYRLSINHVGHGASVYLGWFLFAAQAQSAARRHIGDEEPS